jgi:hypothetical protein
VKHLGVIVRKDLAKIKPPVTVDERNAIAEESIALAGIDTLTGGPQKLDC